MTFLFVLLSIIAGLLLIGLFMKKDHYVKREILINAPLQKVFDFLRMLKNQEKFNKYAKREAGRKWEYSGTDGTVGFIISWNGGREAGCGSKEIMNITEGKKIETEIRFIKPMKVSATVIMETEPISANQTKVNLINTGKLMYPLNIMLPLFQKNFAKDIDESLVNLKNILEN
jgi:hypothetical protein